MTKQELDMKLVKVCESGYLDINKIQELILAGADTNQMCDEENETMTISFSELQRGLCNREDLHPEDKTEQERIGSESRVEENIT